MEVVLENGSASYKTTVDLSLFSSPCTFSQVVCHAAASGQRARYVRALFVCFLFVCLFFGRSIFFLFFFFLIGMRKCARGDMI